ncbi:molybdopterin-dependent oxidoreductase [Dehalogenimonas sp. THU2]|uniref:molybdopterin-dependent oxidoreductase n=1 Tax=Dehalogenimonas sp. THU2 TaxID=3151121 RepID=UPI003218BA8D
MKAKLSYLFVALSLVTAIIAAGCSQPFIPPPGEVEATEFQGVTLTPINNQNNNALAGTQVIDRETYRLTVDGLAASPLTLSYQDLLNLPQVSKLITLHCVEGWSFVAKMTGPSLSSIFDMAGADPAATTVIFYTADAPGGYTSLEMSYIRSQDVIIALKLNDVTLPPDRGFPFQVVAEGKYGYKWAKWVIRIELSSDQDFRGYWEIRGYNNNADITGPRLE